MKDIFGQQSGKNKNKFRIDSVPILQEVNIVEKISNKRSVSMKGFGIVLLVISILGMTILGICAGVTHYQYERDIGSFMDNAYDMNTPEGMLEQLSGATNAMHKVGLNKDDYGAWIFKKPSNSMKFQYSHIEAIIDRAKAVYQWKITTYGKGGQTENLGDVYNTKMDNLRHYIMKDQRSDWIANDTWYVKYHFFFYFPVIFMWIILGGMLITGIVLIAKDDY